MRRWTTNDRWATEQELEKMARKAELDVTEKIEIYEGATIEESFAVTRDGSESQGKMQRGDQ